MTQIGRDILEEKAAEWRASLKKKANGSLRPRSGHQSLIPDP